MKIYLSSIVSIIFWCATTAVFVPGIALSTPLCPHGAITYGALATDASAWANPASDGMHVVITWDDIEHNGEGVYNWNKFNNAYTAATNAGKQLIIGLKFLSKAPTWLVATRYYDSQLGTDPYVLPWDPAVKQKMINTIAAFCAQADGKADAIIMGGLGYDTETYVSAPATLGMTLNAEVAAYTGAATDIINAYAQNLSLTPYIIAAGTPVPGCSTSVMTGIINTAAADPQFGIMQWGLKATSTTSFYINNLIYTNGLNHVVGFQANGSADGSSGGDIEGTLQQMMDAGIAMRAHLIEIYQVDMADPNNASGIEHESSQMLATCP